MEGMFPKVEEVMTDVALMDLVHSSDEFLQELSRRAGLSGRMLHVRRSVFDSSLGETDVEILVENEDGRHALLVENKIDAPVMPMQFERYQLRGRAGVADGRWTSFRVMLFCPKGYFSHLPDEHRRYVDVHLPYEDVIAFAAERPAFAFKKALFEAAVEGHRRGYVKIADEPVMTFYRGYYDIASREFPQLRMDEPVIKGMGSTWVIFPPLNGMRRVSLVHKYLEIGCELSVATKDVAGFCEAVRPFLDEDMVVRETKSIAYVNIRTPPVHHLEALDEAAPKIRKALSALDRLRAFAEKPEVWKEIRRYATP